MPPLAAGTANGSIGWPFGYVLVATVEVPKVGGWSAPWELNCSAVSKFVALSTGCWLGEPKFQTSSSASRAAPATPSPSTSTSSHVA